MAARRSAASAHRRRCEVQIRAAKKMGEPVGSTPVRSPSTQMGSDDNPGNALARVQRVQIFGTSPFAAADFEAFSTVCTS